MPKIILKYDKELQNLAHPKCPVKIIYLHI